MKEINSLPIDASGQYLYVRIFNNGSVAVAVAGMAWHVALWVLFL